MASRNISNIKTDREKHGNIRVACMAPALLFEVIIADLFYRNRPASDIVEKCKYAVYDIICEVCASRFHRAPRTILGCKAHNYTTYSEWYHGTNYGNTGKPCSGRQPEAGLSPCRGITLAEATTTQLLNQLCNRLFDVVTSLDPEHTREKIIFQVIDRKILVKMRDVYLKMELLLVEFENYRKEHSIGLDLYNLPSTLDVTRLERRREKMEVL